MCGITFEKGGQISHEIPDSCPDKGRLANKTMEMFEKAGITCEEMKDKDSRKLIFTNEELKMKFFLANIWMFLPM